jgi:hypothetical protein
MTTEHRILEYRKRNKLSRKAMSALLGVSDRCLFTWETKTQAIPELTAVGIEVWIAAQEGREPTEAKELVASIGKEVAE